MSTESLSIQVPRGFDCYSDVELNHNMASDMSSMYATPGNWLTSTHATQFHPTPPNYLRFPVSSTTTSPDSQSGLTITTAMSNSNAIAPCLSPSNFKSLNFMTYSQDTATVSPQQTHFNPEESSPMSYTSSTFDPHHIHMSPNSTQYASGSQQSAFARGSTSSQTSHDPESPTTKQHSVGRRRKIEHTEPGSARATYLEKNRRAASKCRTKQRRQQEELVEQAREYERKNKCLKAEVAMLQDGMRELMEIVGQHNTCPDRRLRRYVQREADRLAAGTSRTPSLSHALVDMSTDRNS